MSGLLEGRVALVTGGSGALGRAFCDVFAREGARVAFTWNRGAKRAEQTCEAVRAHGAEPLSFQTSVLDRDGMRAVLGQIEERWGDVDVLVNNAGIGQVVPLALMEEADWDQMMDTSVKGAFLCSQAVLRPMIRNRRGHILNVSSLAGVKMMNAPVHYSAAKAALRGFTEALAKEVGRYGIQVNCIAPGVLEGGVSENLPAKRLSQYLDHCALGRIGTVDEVAEVAAMLVSPRNTYMSGATIVIDGAV